MSRPDVGGPPPAGLFGLNREMGYTRLEFLAALPSALAGHEFTVDGDLVTVTVGAGTLRICLGVQRERRFSALLSFPVLPVSLDFKEVDAASQAQFMRRFDLSYMKGLG